MPAGTERGDTMSLKPTHPKDAMNRWINDRESELSPKSIYNYSGQLNQFTDWLLEHDIINMNDVTSETLQSYKEHRSESLKQISLKNDMRTIRAWIRFCERILAVPKGLHEYVPIPTVSKEDSINGTYVTKGESDALLTYLKKYKYGTLWHVMGLILWKTGMRRSGLHSLDLGDVDTERSVLKLRHRPTTGTHLKKAFDSERDVIITDETMQVIQDYIHSHRIDTPDEHGREPLLTSRHGRYSISSISGTVYAMTRPCWYTNTCPFDEDITTCEATKRDHASKCPGSHSPHAFRRGHATIAGNVGQDKDVTGERLDMSRDILDKHYDLGSASDKAERRRQHLKDF
ncbi:tyrosine-type recombinase/integrase [Haladaptatus sp. GCM10025707]|uniref:tyrosine-type recombinase/integrase n=1 Tax=unclassified Haladaptatus TaxID=2622732 RepID=UPI0023E81965|nr:site-specific integrase [Haladaptatus sp. QDMS2]